MKLKKAIAQVLGLIIFFGMFFPPFGNGRQGGFSVNAQTENQLNTQERRQQPFDREEMLK